MWSIFFLCTLACLAAGFEEDDGGPPRVDPEVRAQLEAKVISSMSLKDIEAMVENDERVVNAPKSDRLIVIPKDAGRNGNAYIIHRKTKSPEPKTEVRYAPEGGFSDRQDDSFLDERFSLMDNPTPFLLDDLESAHSEPVRRFYESIADSVLMAASEAQPRYADEESRDGHDRREVVEERDENGCRTIVEKVVDQEDSGKRSRGKDQAKGYVIRKECESPDINGPDAKIDEARPLRQQTALYDTAPSAYESSRPEELDFKESEARDPIAPDYIDSMLEKHFKSFPLFSNSPLSSFKGYQDRFKLRIPDAFRTIKPTVGVQSYEYSNPKSGFEEEGHDSVARDSPRQPYRGAEPEYEDDRKKSSSDSKEPKMMKKSFAYYRKDPPKTDPNDQQYAEEFAQGNYRSFSSSYDSEKDGPKQKKQ